MPFSFAEVLEKPPELYAHPD